jgi:hypothetical protein
MQRSTRWRFPLKVSISISESPFARDTHTPRQTINLIDVVEQLQVHVTGDTHDTPHTQLSDSISVLAKIW